MLELEQALDRILAVLPPSACERAPLSEAAGRVLAGRVLSPIDLPSFDNSAMDGYAVRAADVAQARAESPASLTVCGRVPAGGTFEGELAARSCVRLFTGSPLPAGADAVVMQEDTRPDPSQPNVIHVLDTVEPGENVRRQGSDVRRGSVLAEPGRRLNIGRLCLLAAAGVADVPVGKRPTVALLATGSELRGPGEPLRPAEIYESNCVGLAALATRVGAIPRMFPRVPDTAEATKEALAAAFAEADLVVTCGGVSVGELDFVKSAFERLGGTLDFWKIAIKPGKPFAFGRLGRKFLFGLPGNSVSALVTFLLLVRPALLRWQGARDIALPAHDEPLAEALANPDRRRHFMRVRVETRGTCPAGLQLSHALSALAEADGLVDVPPQTTLGAGTTVKVMRWE